MLRWITGGLGVALIVMWFAWKADVADERATAAANLDVQKTENQAVKDEYAAYKLKVEQANTDNATEFANATRELWLEFRAQQAEADRVRLAGAAKEKQRIAESQALRRELQNVPLQERSRLGPGALAYLERVRQQQRTQAGNTNRPPSP